MPKVSSLGHVGLHVTDYPKMRDFYTRVLGFTVTDEDADRQMCFLSAQPGEEHHELLITSGREASSEVKLLQQLSFHVGSLQEVREFRQVFEAESVEISRAVTHGNTASLYFLDPEGNRLEVYYTVPVDWHQPFSKPIDLDMDDEALLQHIHDVTFGAEAR
jgi:catechol-2,3-dioxygenase